METPSPPAEKFTAAPSVGMTVETVFSNHKGVTVMGSLDHGHSVIAKG